MAQPKVTFTELDGQLAAIAAGGGILPILGPADSGDLNKPTGIAKISGVLSTFGGGPLVEDCCYAIDRFGLKVLAIRTGTSVAGSYPEDDEVVETNRGAGTSDVTVDNVGSEPNGDYEVVIRFVTGGTVGTAGIIYQWSLDGGRTFSGRLALGTANEIVLSEAGGVTVELAAGTIIAGFEASFVTRAPNWNATEIGTALEALKLSKVAWDLALISGVIGSGTEFDAIDGKFVGMGATGKYKSWIGSTRLPDVGESAAAYAAAMVTAFGAKASKHGALCSGAVQLTSALTGRKYRRPLAAGAGALEASLPIHVNSAAIGVGGIPGATITDGDGNPLEYDESAYGTLDDARFYVARSWDDYAGTYPNIPRIFSPNGSDFRLIPHRRVMNAGLRAVHAYLNYRLSQDLEVNKQTGYLLEEVAKEIELGATKAAETVLRAFPSCSSVRVKLSRDDKVLSNAPVTGSLKIVPLAYPEGFVLEAGFENPALSLQ